MAIMSPERTAPEPTRDPRYCTKPWCRDHISGSEVCCTGERTIGGAVTYWATDSSTGPDVFVGSDDPITLDGLDELITALTALREEIR